MSLRDKLFAPTEEELKKWKDDRIEKIRSLSFEIQLGRFVGDVVAEDLPTLSTDLLQSKKVIQVSNNETIYINELYEQYFSTGQYGSNQIKNDDNTFGDKILWNTIRLEQRRLELKYLPNPYCKFIRPINIENMNMDSFKRGLMNSLWDCDYCSYNIDPENIKVYFDNEFYFTVIELRLDTDEEFIKRLTHERKN